MDDEIPRGQSEHLVSVQAIFKTWNEIIEKIRSGEIRTATGYECSECFNSGFREVPDPQGGHYKGVVRCDRCRYWEFARERMAA